MSDEIIVNETPLSDLGLSGREFGGWLRGYSRQRDVTVLPGMYGVIPHASASVQPIEISLAFQSVPASVAARQTTLATAHRFLDRGLLELRFVDRPDLVIECELVDSDADALVRPQFLDPTLVHEFSLRAYLPYRRDRYTQVVHLAAGEETPVPLGTLPSHGYLFLHGEDAVVTYRHVSGAPLAQMILTWGSSPDPPGVYVSGDYWRIDLAGHQVEKITSSGTLDTNDFDALTAYAGSFFQPNPRDGDPDNSAWPTIESDVDGLYIYDRLWR